MNRVSINAAYEREVRPLDHELHLLRVRMCGWERLQLRVEDAFLSRPLEGGGGAPALVGAVLALGAMALLRAWRRRAMDRSDEIERAKQSLFVRHVVAAPPP